MTIKHTDKTISAESENVITDVTLNEGTGILTFTQKNFYTGDSTTFTRDLSGIKLRIVKLASQSALTSLENDNTQEDYKKTHLFLVPLSGNNTEGIYAEYIYVEDSSTNVWSFERIGSTELDLSNYVQKSNTNGVIKNNGDILAIDNTSGGTGSSTNLITSGAVNAGLNGKANSIHNHSSSNITDMDAVTVTITYTDNTTETLTLFKQHINNS